MPRISGAISVIALGNGTACRETENLVAQVLADDVKDLNVRYLIVNEAGASVYSTSQLGREELPRYDATVRGAVSIGRRVLDPAPARAGRTEQPDYGQLDGQGQGEGDVPLHVGIRAAGPRICAGSCGRKRQLSSGRFGSVAGPTVAAARQGRCGCRRRSLRAGGGRQPVAEC